MENTFEFRENNVLLDIEGTTTSISFVKDNLFQYVRKHLEEYINENWHTQELQDIIDLLKKQNTEDQLSNFEGLVQIRDDDLKITILKNVLWQMDLDRKTYGLKKLQGLIWKKGIYDDVPPALKLWKSKGKNICIYSSGSVEAQKLLFKHTEYGDLLEMFSGNFDTNVGVKIDPQSYSTIADALECKTSDILFITDAIKEAEAAVTAGCNVFISERPGNTPLSSEDKQKYVCIHSFSQVIPEDK